MAISREMRGELVQESRSLDLPARVLIAVMLAGLLAAIWFSVEPLLAERGRAHPVPPTRVLAGDALDPGLVVVHPTGDTVRLRVSHDAVVLAQHSDLVERS